MKSCHPFFLLSDTESSRQQAEGLAKLYWLFKKPENPESLGKFTEGKEKYCAKGNSQV
jgi:hypothetical protein